MSNDTARLADKLRDEQDKLLDQLADADFSEPANSAAEAPTAPPVATDPEAERQAFAELLAHFKSTDDGDADTVVTALDLAAFAEETFSPVPAEEPQS